jgi:outer membrane immunogenic protein
MVEEIPTAVSWTGLYFGIEGGGGAYNHELNSNLPIFGGVGINIDGFSGEGWQAGGVLGFDWHLPGSRFVLGVLGGGHWSNMEAEASVLGIATASLESQFGFDVLARGGWLATPDTLVYVLGGGSWERWEGSLSVPLFGLNISDDEEAWGWTVGAGLEVRLNDRLSLKGEYRYTQFDSIDFGVPGGLLSLDPSRHVALMGVNYRLGAFGGGGGYTPQPMGPYNWTGFYAGLAGGGGIIDYDTDVLGGVANIDGFGAQGALVEGTVGFDYQVNALVLGVLADAHWSNHEASASVTTVAGGGTASLESQWGFDVLARGGVAATERTLVYGLLGYSWEQFEGSLSIPPLAVNISDEEDASGWTVGGGIEVAATNRLSVKGEYRFTGFEDFDFGTGGLLSMEGNRHTGRIGVNYRFGGPFGANY